MKTNPLLRSLIRGIVRVVVLAYLRLWHDFKIEGLENVPASGPALALSNHASNLDGLALMAADPFPDSTVVAKASLSRIPVVGFALAQWDAITVERQGRDTGALRAVLSALKQGRVVAMMAEGRRSRNGKLGGINPVLARLAVRAGVPIIPVAITGSFAALPPGAHFPRRQRVRLRVGRPFVLPPNTEDASAAESIHAAIARLLPLEQLQAGSYTSRLRTR